MKTYNQLSLDERYRIAAMKNQRYSQAEIARQLGRSPSTISRELRRNSVQADVGIDRDYWPRDANRFAKERRAEKAERQRKIQGELKVFVEEKLRLSWSPEHISGRLRLEEHPYVCPETIYQHILRDRKTLGFYRYCLRFGGYKRHRFKSSRMAERTRERKHHIDQRSAAANARTELGHWERDCLLGKRGGSAILTLLERKSRYVRLVHVPRLETDVVAAATRDALRDLPVKSITNDNGIEFQRDEKLQTEMGIPIYFCDPCSPWQRGSVENVNGLIRQYFPKRSDFDALPRWAPLAVEETLNFRPRRVLGYRTPYEVFHNRRLSFTTNPLLHFGLEISDVN
jgi:IS30 family transposase